VTLHAAVGAAIGAAAVATVGVPEGLAEGAAVGLAVWSDRVAAVGAVVREGSHLAKQWKLQ
jgi:hypothetical protein